MKILSISLDNKIFDRESPAAKRLVSFSEFCEEIHVLVLGGGEDKKISPGIWVYSAGRGPKFRRFFAAFKKCRRIIKERKIDLVASQDPFWAGLLGWLVAQKKRIPLQIQIHTDFLSPFFQVESLANKFKVAIAKFILPKAACVRVASNRIKRSLEESGLISAGKTFELPVFVDLKDLQSRPVKADLKKKYPQFNFILLMVSRITREKNIGLALKALTEVLPEYPQTGLVIAGEGPLSEELAEISWDLKIEKNVVFEPWIDDPFSYYKTADLFLITSNYEGFGLTALEAAASGCPVAMADTGCAGEIIKDGVNGFIFPVGDKKALVAILKKVLNSPRLLDSFKKPLKPPDIFLEEKAYFKKMADLFRVCSPGR